ncbi:TetR/AcrR family transcriptional regulator [Leucobacter albus]|uniref:TetR/AcrR family transcriptional regulator n=1 Tax=Leucobacter albus TaxID=272210 RepID=A0ABW3TL51_9MICO
MEPSEYSLGADGAAPARTLAERRRERTRLEIARAAAHLFAEQGPENVTAEEIAEAAGISLRTFYRYFGAKEEAITPLLTSGADNWVDLLTSAAEKDPLELFPRLIDEVLVPKTAADREELRVTRGVLRTVAETPLLRAAWHRVNFDSEARLRPILTEICGPDADPFEVRLLATVASDAIRLGLEHWAAGDADPDGSGGTPARLAQEVFARLSRGLAD